MWHTLRHLITAVALILGLYFLVVQPVEQFVSRTGSAMKGSLERALGAVTGRKTRVCEGRAELTGSAEINELSLLELHMSATRTIEKSEKFSGLPLGTKKLVVRGHFHHKKARMRKHAYEKARGSLSKFRMK